MSGPLDWYDKQRGYNYKIKNKRRNTMKELYNQQCPACGYICKPNVESHREQITPKYLYVTAVYRCAKCNHKWHVDYPVSKLGRIHNN